MIPSYAGPAFPHIMTIKLSEKLAASLSSMFSSQAQLSLLTLLGLVGIGLSVAFNQCKGFKDCNSALDEHCYNNRCLTAQQIMQVAFAVGKFDNYVEKEL